MELFKDDYKTFPPIIYWVVGSYKEISKHKISGYRKYKNDWYIRVFTNVLGEKNIWTWHKIKPSHVSKDKAWALRMAVENMKSFLQREIKREEERIEKSKLRIEKLNLDIQEMNKNHIEVNQQVKKFFNSTIRI